MIAEAEELEVSGTESDDLPKPEPQAHEIVQLYIAYVRMQRAKQEVVIYEDVLVQGMANTPMAWQLLEQSTYLLILAYQSCSYVGLFRL